MVEVTFVSAEGKVQTVQGDDNFSLMEVARRNGVDGIVAECGGSCACATCHVYVDPAWQAIVGSAGQDEDEVLDFVGDRRPGSRLSCQIRLSAKLDGLVVTTPDRQG